MLRSAAEKSGEKSRRPRKKDVVRIGRPPKELAAKVDERILEAARRLFLERGLSGVSVEEIARDARASKGTIYARFPTKEALFAAITLRNAAEVRAGFEGLVPGGATIEERLTNEATEILNHLLAGDTVAFMRLAIAEVHRFPQLINVERMMRERGTQMTMAGLKEVTRSEQSDIFPAFAPERLAKTTEFFLNLVVSPLLMRGVFGQPLKSLRAEIPSHVSSSVSFFLAACRR